MYKDQNTPNFMMCYDTTHKLLSSTEEPCVNRPRGLDTGHRADPCVAVVEGVGTAPVSRTYQCVGRNITISKSGLVSQNRNDNYK